MTSAAWTAPSVERREPDRLAGDREGLEQYLDYHRATLLTKCAGLTAEQMALRAAPPSRLSLLGLVRHLTAVERWWFRMHVAREDVPLLFWSGAYPDEDFDDVDPVRAQADLAAYLDEVGAARAAAANHPLEEVVASRGHRRDVTMNVRWVYVHMIEEYARHNGHADLLREAVDGSTGE